MLAEYYFKIKHVRGLNNGKTNTFSRKSELQKNDKISGILLKENKDGKIKYNHPQLLITYKTPVSLWIQKIQETQSKDENLENYKNQKAMYIPKSITEEFIKEFHINLTQRHNRTIALIRRLEKEYIIHKIYALV